MNSMPRSVSLLTTIDTSSDSNKDGSIRSWKQIRTRGLAATSQAQTKSQVFPKTSDSLG